MSVWAEIRVACFVVSDKRHATKSIVFAFFCHFYTCVAADFLFFAVAKPTLPERPLHLLIQGGN